ncbi:MAG: serpin family protein [Gemmataceae bacterium]|nr:serpin family protein [Gemmata sp.]MDW8197713.1 serpin family protein [Gemmataceae bacterium]
MNTLSRRQMLAASAAMAAGTLAPRWGLTQEKPDITKLVAGNTAFGCDLYGQLQSERGNLFLSPFSISTALAMTAAGAKGKTWEEMEKVLHLPPNAPAAFGAVLKSLNDEPDAKKRGFTLSTANALWAQKGYPWRPEYKTLVATDFAAGLFDVDYQTDPETARATINTWVEKETRDKIKNLLPPGSITMLTRLVLTNAIYFKGDWDVQFKKEDTKEQPFILADGTKKNTPLMFRVGGYNYAETDRYQVLDLPYVGKRISMTVILPRKPDGLPAVEKELTGAQLTTLLQSLRYEKQVHVHLPKFKVEKSFTLNEPLKVLGMRTAFQRDADFSGMHTGGEDLHITAVIHKAYVDVNEEGTEAAAATGVVVAPTSVAEPPKPKYFRADHPFLFLIRDLRTQSVLFMGRLTEPTH